MSKKSRKVAKQVKQLMKFYGSARKIGLHSDYLDTLISEYNKDSVEFMENLCDEDLTDYQMQWIRKHFNW